MAVSKTGEVLGDWKYHTPEDCRELPWLCWVCDGKKEIAHPCMLYTAFGGPLAPKEPGDPTLKDSEREESEKFWSQHALVEEGEGA
jgi:hypothetical protein